MENPVVWSFVIGLVLTLLAQGAKHLAPRLEDNRWAIRAGVVLVAALVSVTQQLVLTGLPVDWALWLTQTITIVGSAEWSWQWVLKTLQRAGER